MFWAKKSYFRRIFDLRHFYGPDDNLYHPTRESPGKRRKTAKSGMAQKTAPIGTVTGRKPIVAYKNRSVGTKIHKPAAFHNVAGLFFMKKLLCK